MEVPQFVRRAARRVLAGGVACLVVIAVGGLVGERLRFGADFASARDRIAADVQEQFDTLSRRLDTVAARLRQDPVLVRAVESRETTAIRELFDRLASEARQFEPITVAVSVLDPAGRSVAWAGRPSPLPPERVSGPDALFLAPSATGLRLTRVAPVREGSPERRAATIVVEAPLARVSTRLAVEDFVLPTSLIPVPLRLTFESGATVPPGAIIIRDPEGLPLARADVPAGAVAAARDEWQRRVIALLMTVVCVGLLLFTGPLLDWRRQSASVRAHLALTLAILGLLVGARIIAWYALRLAGLDAPSLAPRDTAGLFIVALASPADFLLSALLFGAIVGLGAASFEQARHSRRLRVRVVPDSAAVETLLFVLAQLASGALVGLLLVAYERFLRTRLAMMPYDLLHFSLHPFEWSRLMVGIGLVILHAALLALAVLLFRMAAARWVVAGDRRWIRAAIPMLWTAPALLLFVWLTQGWEQAPLFPAGLIVAVAVVAAWRLRRYRARLAHASQAARLTALFFALAMPSVVFYPSLVDAADRARRQVIEARDAPEVINQRRNLQLQLNAALEQIDALPDLAELVSVGVPVEAGPAPYETAFRVWERTVLEDLRLTSSVELHDASGALVSRFALKLPHTGGPPTYQETTCEWELFEEVSPFFAEERRLLHAGRGICVETPEGRRVVGAIAIHVILDYSNLSFVSAQSPYVALLRNENNRGEAAPRERVDFTVYGWSRRPLYMSGRDAWALPEATFARILESREPFWGRARLGDDEFDVYFLNDRGGIYALGYPLTSPFGHLISVAEVLVLGAATFTLLLLAGLIYGRIAARTPMSGRALLREVRASFYRKLFIAFVAAAVVPVLALALVTRAYIAGLMQDDLEMEAARTAASASRVVEDVGLLELTGGTGPGIVDDDLVVWLSRVIAQDVNIFDGAGLLASSERSLYAYGLLPRSTQGDVYRAIVLEGRPSFVARETVGATEYLVAAAPVRVQNRQAILTVPLTLRQQEIEAQIDELDRRVLLAAVLFIILGALIGYSMAERIADPVNRLIKATGRIARGDLNARIVAASSDEFRRLVDAFNRMAADLQRQRGELERSHRLAAWADMARQVAHDIKNPLTPIQLNAEHLRRVHEDRGTPLGHVLDECVTNILNQVRLLRQIASEFSSFATSPTAKPRPEALHTLIADVVDAYRVGLKERVAIEVDVAPDLPLVLVDKAVLARGLTNIIENALHAMPGGGTLRLVGTARDAGRVELAIADTGVGMDAVALERIFEPYFSTRASGTGLGLTIAKRNVELNGGTIEVESQRGAGTTVRITLPTVPAAA